MGHLPRPTSRPARVAERVAERPTIQPTALAVHWNGQIQRRPRRPDGRTGWLLFPADVSDRLLRAYLRIRWEVERRGLADIGRVRAGRVATGRTGRDGNMVIAEFVVVCWMAARGRRIDRTATGTGHQMRSSTVERLAGTGKGGAMPTTIKVNDGAGERLEALAKLRRRSAAQVVETLSHADMGTMPECEAARAVAGQQQPAGKGGRGHVLTERVLAAALLAALAVGCSESPVAPSAPVGPAEVTLSASPTTARVGGIVTFAVWLSRPLDRGLEIWMEAKSPTRDWSAHTRTGPSTYVRSGSVQSNELSTGILTADSVGDYGLRIVGDRLPDGVVLGEPSSVAWSVVP